MKFGLRNVECGMPAPGLNREAGKPGSRKSGLRAFAPSLFILLISVLCPLSSGSELRYMRVTAYCPCEICCGPHACGLTASGRPAVGDLVAVDPRRVPLGSMVHVPGRSWNLAADTGRDIKGNRVDLLCATHEEARRFGVRWLAVTISPFLIKSDISRVAD